MSVNDHIIKLGQRRGQIKGLLTRMSNYINDESNQVPENMSGLKLRADKIVALWDAFDSVQSEIELLTNPGDETATAERSNFEMAYFQALSRHNELCAHLSQLRDNTTVHVSDESDAEDNNATRRTNQIKLPQIELGKFDGSYDRWMSFHDTFTSLIHNNADLSIIQKFQYLKTVLVGDAANCIEAIEITSDNYVIAWRLLLDRYHNKRLIIKNHIRDIFEMEQTKKGSPQALRKMLDDIQRHMRSLTALKLPTGHWDPLIVHLITSKLDQQTLYHWETHCAGHIIDGLPTLNDLLGFLKRKCQASESLAHTQPSQPSVSVKTSSTVSKGRTQGNFVAAVNHCPKCDGGHLLYQCFQFKKLTLSQRFKCVNDKGLCVQCLCRHVGKPCDFHVCYICRRAHHHLLHDVGESSSDYGNSRNVSGGSNNTGQPRVVMAATSPVRVLLSTVRVLIDDCGGKEVICRALLDSGAQSNFMTERLFRKLRLRGEPVNIPVSGITQDTLNIKTSVRATMRSTYGQYEVTMNFLVIDKIAAQLPTLGVGHSIKIPANIRLADPTFHVGGGIDLLIGAETFYQSLRGGQIGLANGPVLQGTIYGWIVSGPLFHVGKRPGETLFTGFSMSCGRCGGYSALGEGEDERADNTISRFWEFETLTQPNTFSRNDKFCEALYAETTTRDKVGRYEVRLPLRPNHGQLGQSYRIALRRFLSLERRLDRDHHLRQQYREFINEYIALGHMSPSAVGTFHANREFPQYFLPHHAVFKESSSTTKLRVVFDGSSKSTSGISLNDVLFTGPNLQRDIFEVLMRFRRHRIALVADIEKMYRQIEVSPAHRGLQQILWGDNQGDQVVPYTLNTVTYGTGCAAYLAIKTLKQLAMDERGQFPTISEIVLGDFYVDDLLSGADTLEEAKFIYQEINMLMKRGGFNLRKWKSNDRAFLARMSLSESDDTNIPINYSDGVKTLGMKWDTRSDTFQFDSSLMRIHKTATKRHILSTIACLYDPLGLVGPVIVRAKLLMQRIWLSKCNWDDIVPQDIAIEWNIFTSNLSALNDICIPRRYVGMGSASRQIHGFCDASEVAYGACVYLRSFAANGCHSTLVASKSRIAPLSKASLPRLELCGALLLANLLHKVTTNLGLDIEGIHLWTDSMIVLSWLRSESNRFKTFVANRISAIQELTSNAQWRHVLSADNPADIISRGMHPADINASSLWWHGPAWLSGTLSEVPERNVDFVETVELPETRVCLSVINGSECELAFTEKYSSFIRVNRIVAYLFRFIHNCSNPRAKITSGLSFDELNNSRYRIIMTLQRISFPMELHALKSGRSLHRTSKLLSLNPFLDGKGMMRVGGRLQNSNLPYHSKHQILLPGKNHLTKLMVRDAHILNLHASPQMLLCIIRRHYWPIDGGNIVRQVFRACITCFRASPNITTQIMGNLPKDRLIPAAPFSICGVDYCGPFLVKPMTRSRAKLKIYIAVFVCFATKAIHLELASDLSTSSFLKTMIRFMSRRGQPRVIWSDNATNFVGANRELTRFIQSSGYNDKMSMGMQKFSVRWKFIPARSPHMGGIWEAGVKSVKYHLNRVANDANLNYDDFHTLMAQIENLLNNRPLYPLSNNPNDYEPLTPSHFLLAATNANVELPTNGIKHYQHITTIREHFWKRWSHEYLHNLQQRTKWRIAKDNNVCVGDLAVLRDDNLPPSLWSMGRIKELHKGMDGKIRVVTLKTKNGETKRAIHRIAILPRDV